MGQKTIQRQREYLKDALTFLKWVIYACFIGILVGAVGIVFHHGIDMATHLRGEIPDMIWFLPFGGLAIVLMYAATGMEKDRGTNQVLVAVRDGQQLKLRTAPLIFTSTIVTHMVGGSAGREGAALQLGGSWLLTLAVWSIWTVRITGSWSCAACPPPSPPCLVPR